MKQKNEAHKLILQATPILIYWNLWKNICACQYEAKTSNCTRERYAIYNDNYKLIMSIYPQVNWPPTWYGIIKHDERFIQITEVQKTTWTKPPDLWIKNAGWSVHDNPGKIGAGGILRY